jgi:hypothetical protein
LGREGVHLRRLRLWQKTVVVMYVGTVNQGVGHAWLVGVGTKLHLSRAWVCDYFGRLTLESKGELRAISSKHIGQRSLQRLGPHTRM